MIIAIIKMVIGVLGILGFGYLTYIFAKAPIKDENGEDIDTNRNGIIKIIMPSKVKNKPSKNVKQTASMSKNTKTPSCNINMDSAMEETGLLDDSCETTILPGAQKTASVIGIDETEILIEN